MQIVIDVDENVFTRLFDNGTEDYEIMNDDLFAIAKSIRNGTPLPKGHGRLIDADNVISKICGSECGCHLKECVYDKPCYSVARIESATTIIEADSEE